MISEKTMKAAVYHGVRDIRIDELPIPEIGPDDVLLRSRMAAVCGSDIHPYRTGKCVHTGQIFGHEYVAEVAEVGANIKHYKIGDRVYGANYAPCGKCWYCRRGDPAHCVHSRDSFTGQGLPGAFAQYFRFIMPERPDPPTKHINTLMHIPDSVSDEQAALIEPFGVGLAAVETCSVKPGDVVVVLGAGPIGLSIIQWIKSLNATAVSVDVSQRRLECAKLCGADYVISNEKGDCYEQVVAIFGETGWLNGPETAAVDTVIDSAGYPLSFNDALKTVKCGGTVCQLAVTETMSEVNTTYITYKDIRILSSTECDAAGALDGIISGRVHPELLVDGHISLEEITEAFEKQSHAQAIKLLVKMKES